MFAFLGNNPHFMSAELKGAKAIRSGRENYGDNAIGWVQIKRDGSICTVKAKVTSEHSIRKKAYSVQLICDEQKDNVISVQCEDCAASLGGCKHAVALLTWIHRRSEEPPKTSVLCYWKKSVLSSVGTSLKFIKAEDLGKSKPLQIHNNTTFLNCYVDHSLELNVTNTVLTKFFKTDTEIEKLSLHLMLEEYITNSTSQNITAEAFSEFCVNKMSMETCNQASNATADQADSFLWHELRFLRITASKAYDVAHCNNTEGSLVESLLGASKLKDSDAMARGRRLEQEIIKIAEKEIKQKINRCGLMLVPEHPFIGASPDGISADYVIEVKCPSSAKSFKRYITLTNNITAKYKAQVQMQMFCLKKKNCLFCVAKEDFEESKMLVLFISIMTFYM